MKIMKTLRMIMAFCMVILISITIAHAQTQPLSKYDKWLTPSYFRGFNATIWSNVIDDVLTQEDFNDLKATGANLAILQTQGLVKDTFPYGSNDPFYIEGLDALVNYCRNAGLYYVISVRSGPGRRDVWEEGEGLVKPSTIWTNKKEQKLYANMLKEIVQKYLGDKLFVGLDMIQEPNPYDDDAYGLPLDVLDRRLTADGIDVNHIYSIFIDSIRTVDPDLPLIVQSVHWSDPEYFSLIELQDDDKIIYNTHCYNPHEYSHADKPKRSKYPGTFWVNTLDREEFWDKDFIRNTILAPVRAFQVKHNVPILLGEFGLQYAQGGGKQYLTDMVEIAYEFGWHFTFWSFRADPVFNYELMGKNYWNTVCDLMTYSP